MNLTGYIDESINKDMRLFTMSAIIAERMDWMWFEVDWENCIERINRLLKKDGRTPISRYHASECSNTVGDFNDWSQEEQRSLTKQLLDIFRAHNTRTISYTIDFIALAETFPQWKNDPLQGGYYFLTAFLVREIAEWLGKRDNPNDRIKLIHDRCQYNQTIQNSFQELLSNQLFKQRFNFETIKSSSWQECRLLQAADFITYAGMKEAGRKINSGNRSLPLKLLLDMESFGMTAKYIGSDEVNGIAKAWEAHVESLSS
jgi:hypothetical protein